MPHLPGDPRELAGLLRQQDRVVNVASALASMSPKELRWRVTSGRWQRPCRGIIVAHSGPLTERQRLWVMMAGVYPPYTDYQTRTNREIPVVVLEPRS